MDFCFDLVAIFLIFDMTSSRSVDNGFSKKKRNSDNIELNSDVASLRQSFINSPSIQNNPFLHLSNSNKSGNSISNGFPSQISDIVFPDDNYNSISNKNLQPSNGNKNGNSISSNGFLLQTSDIVFPDYNYNFFSNNSTNSFLNPMSTDSTINVKSSSPPNPITQSSYTQTAYYHTSASNIFVSNIPAFNTSVPNNFSTFSTPSSKNHSSVSSLMKDLLDTTLSPEKPISQLKCEEYVREIVGTTSTMSLTDSSSKKRKINACDGANRLVIDGYEAEVGEFPHMVALGKHQDNEFIQLCGGTLISHTWVLSAAHCSFGIIISNRVTVAKLGIIRLSDQEGITVNIKRAISHPDFKRSQKYADIALLQLMNAVTFSTVIRPACLYQEYDSVPRRVWITGWGVTQFDDDMGSDRLQKAQLDVVDSLYCSTQYNSYTGLPYGIATSMICAGDPRGNWTKDSCLGDSGGPLQVHFEGECLFQVIGITSFGKGCALVDIPSVYTRISYYLSWIEDNVWPQKQ